MRRSPTLSAERAASTILLAPSPARAWLWCLVLLIVLLVLGLQPRPHLLGAHRKSRGLPLWLHGSRAPRGLPWYPALLRAPSSTDPHTHGPFRDASRLRAAVFDNYSARCWVNGEPLELSLWDTAGQADYDPLRPLSYPGTHCFIVVCSVDSDASVRAMMSKWLVELKHHNPDAPFILCCNKVDLLDAEKAAGAPGAADLDLDAGRKVIRMAQQHSQTEPGCAGFFACSARTQDNLKALFDTAIRVGLSYQRGELKPVPPKRERRLCTVL